MWFGEPHSFPEKGSPTRLSTSGQQVTKGDRVDQKLDRKHSRSLRSTVLYYISV